MGPRHCCRGIAFKNVTSADHDAASMGPRHCCRGILLRACEGASPTISFNGAAALLPRNQRRAIEAAERARLASMGPRHCCRGIPIVPNNDMPSMQALQWGRGIAAAESLLPRTLSFEDQLLQWGRGIAAAESALGLRIRDQLIELQWGRGIAAAESDAQSSARPPTRTRFNGAAALLPRNRDDRVQRGRTPIASMGPRHCCRGICWAMSGPRCAGRTLQWGRGIAAAESTAPAAGDTALGAASMGPRHCCRGIAAPSLSAQAVFRGFNGAAALLPRNPRMSF